MIPEFLLTATKQSASLKITMLFCQMCLGCVIVPFPFNENGIKNDQYTVVILKLTVSKCEAPSPGIDF